VCDEPLIAPISGKPCLSYYYAVDAEWTETVVDRSNPATTRQEVKHRSLGSDGNTADFAIDDGSGAVRVAAAQSGDIERKESPSQIYVSRSANEPSIMLGNLVYSAANFPAGTRFTATERLLEPVDTLFACGRLTDDSLGSSSLIVSTRTIDELIADNATTAAFGSAFGWICTVAGALMLAWGLLFVSPAGRAMPSASPLPPLAT